MENVKPFLSMDVFDFILGTIVISIALALMVILFMAVLITVNIRNRFAIERFIMSRQFLYPIIKRGLGIYNFSKSEAIILIKVLQSYTVGYYGDDIETNFDPNKIEEKTSESPKIIPICGICSDKQSEIINIPCGHFFGCIECYSRHKKINYVEMCSICNREISKTTKLHI